MVAVSLGLKFYLARQGRWAKRRAEKKLHELREAGKEHARRGGERLGVTSEQRPDGPLVWFHVGSEADAMAIPSLVEHLFAERSDLNILITTRVFDPDMPLAERLPPGVIHQYAPYDFPHCAKAFIGFWQPDVCLWSDSVLYPALLEESHRAGIPLFMTAGRMNAEAQRRFRRFPGMTKALLSRFETILAGDDRNAANLRRLGAPAGHIQVTGFLQEGAEPLPCDPSERDALAALLAARPVWLAVGVAPGEEPMISAAHRHAIRRSHRLLLIAVPDDPALGEPLARTFAAEGWTVARRGAGERPEPDVQVFVADLPDEAGLWYRLAPISFMGQTLAGGPGRNPFEAAALGSVVLFGPGATKYRGACVRLEEAGAAVRTRDAPALGAAVETLLSPDVAARMAMAAWDVTTSGAGVMDRICELVLETLDRKGL